MRDTIVLMCFGNNKYQQFAGVSVLSKCVLSLSRRTEKFQIPRSSILSKLCFKNLFFKCISYESHFSARDSWEHTLVIE